MDKPRFNIGDTVIYHSPYGDEEVTIIDIYRKYNGLCEWFEYDTVEYEYDWLIDEDELEGCNANNKRNKV
jgi:hypothetical protein